VGDGDADCATAAMQKQSSHPSGASRFVVISRVWSVGRR
jgi:hypothetical protein